MISHRDVKISRLQNSDSIPAMPSFRKDSAADGCKEFPIRSRSHSRGSPLAVKPYFCLHFKIQTKDVPLAELFIGRK